MVSVRTKDGRTLARTGDVSQPMRDLEAQQAKLERKFLHLASKALGEPRARELAGLVRRLETLPSLAPLLDLCRAG